MASSMSQETEETSSSQEIFDLSNEECEEIWHNGGINFIDVLEGRDIGIPYYQKISLRIAGLLARCSVYQGPCALRWPINYNRAGKLRANMIGSAPFQIYDHKDQIWRYVYSTDLKRWMIPKPEFAPNVVIGGEQIKLTKWHVGQLPSVSMSLSGELSLNKIAQQDDGPEPVILETDDFDLKSRFDRSHEPPRSTPVKAEDRQATIAELANTATNTTSLREQINDMEPHDVGQKRAASKSLSASRGDEKRPRLGNEEEVIADVEEVRLRASHIDLQNITVLLHRAGNHLTNLENDRLTLLDALDVLRGDAVTAKTNLEAFMKSIGHILAEEPKRMLTGALKSLERGLDKVPRHREKVTEYDD